MDPTESVLHLRDSMRDPLLFITRMGSFFIVLHVQKELIFEHLLSSRDEVAGPSELSLHCLP